MLPQHLTLGTLGTMVENSTVWFHKRGQCYFLEERCTTEVMRSRQATCHTAYTLL